MLNQSNTTYVHTEADFDFDSDSHDNKAVILLFG